MNTSTTRIDSIDVFRALTMFLMIFVNDLWSLIGVPKWLEHAGATEDFLGFADTIFPAFLFIVGMSIPFAVRNRRKKGESDGQIFGHMIIRSGILIVMGVFTVNLEDFNADATGISRAVFQILMVLGFFMAWNEYPKKDGMLPWSFVTLRGLGFVLLLFLAYIYRGGENTVETNHTLQTSWWGILGLIGWSYLLCALLYLLIGHKKQYRMLTFVFFLFLLIAHHAKLFSGLGFDPSDWIPGGGAFHVFTFGGILLASHLDEKGRSGDVKKMATVPVVTAIVFIILGFLLRHWWIMSKIQATPPWVLVCTGINILVFLMIWVLVDKGKKKNWFRIIEPAGNATLSCYLLPYLVYSMNGFIGLHLSATLRTGIIGLVSSLVFSLLIIIIAGLLSRIHIRLKI